MVVVIVVVVVVIVVVVVVMVVMLVTVVLCGGIRNGHYYNACAGGFDMSVVVVAVNYSFKLSFFIYVLKRF